MSAAMPSKIVSPHDRSDVGIAACGVGEFNSPGLNYPLRTNIVTPARPWTRSEGPGSIGRRRISGLPSLDPGSRAGMTAEFRHSPPLRICRALRTGHGDRVQALTQ